jgi:DNA-binding MarR family transcriptional regulator
MSALASVSSMSFTDLRAVVDATDGNLATHSRKLEVAEYISVHKEFVGRKPLTTFSMTTTGRAAFERYIDALEALLPRR